MLDQLAPLLSHYAKRINVVITAHPKGIQVMINVMPCPEKVSDESLRQQLIEPIVVAGDVASVNEQLSGLKDLLGTALANDTLNASVEAYNAKLNGAKSTGNKGAQTKAKAPEKATTPAPSAPAAPVAPAASNALEDFLVQETENEAFI